MYICDGMYAFKREAGKFCGRERNKVKGNVKREAEIDFNDHKPKDSKECQPTIRNRKESLPESPERAQSYTHLDFRFLPPQLSKEYLSAVLRYHQVMPQEMDTPRYKMMNKIPEFMKMSPGELKKKVSGTRINNAKILFIALKCLKRQFPHDIFFFHILWMYT